MNIETLITQQKITNTISFVNEASKLSRYPDNIIAEDTGDLNAVWKKDKDNIMFWVNENNMCFYRGFKNNTAIKGLFNFKDKRIPESVKRLILEISNSKVDN